MVLKKIILISLLVFLASVIAGCSNSSKPEAVVNSYFENIKNQQYSQAVSKFSSNVFLLQGLNKEQMEERMQKAYNQNSTILKESKILESKNIDDTHKVLKVQSKGVTNGKEFSNVDSILVVKQNEEWKIDFTDALSVVKAKKYRWWNVSGGKLTISEIMVGNCVEGTLLRFKIENQTNNAIQLGWANDWYVKITTDKGQYTVPIKAPVRIASGGNDIIFAKANDAKGTVQKATLQGVYFLDDRGLPNGEAKTFDFDVVL